MLPKKKESILFCVCAPAGSGKSTVCRRLTEEDAALTRSISTTTRAPREGEVNGEHYHFVTESEFDRRVASGAFVEHAEFNGNKYGTERVNIEQAAAGEADLLMAIDIQGVRQLKKIFTERVVTVFLFPPSFESLKERLRRRATESEEVQARRLAIAEREIEDLSEPGFADYLVLNDELEEAVFNIKAVISAERQRFSRIQDEFLQSVLRR